MAQGLIQQEAAAVVAMQFPISDDAAIVFTRDFYGAVADGEPLDQAMASARKALLADHGAEWATPVLFLRAADGRVFDRREEPGRLAASRPPLTLADPATTHWAATRPNIQQVPMADVPEAHVSSSQDWRALPSAVPSMPPNLKESGRQSFASLSETEPLLDKPSGRSYERAAPSPRRRHTRYWVGAAAAITIAAVISIALALGRTPHSLTSHVSVRASASPSGVAEQPGKSSAQL